MAEIWKDVVGFEGRYLVSNLGNVKTLNYNKTKQERLLKFVDRGHGYLAVSIASRYVAVHRLVCEAFLSDWDAKLTVNHKNGVKTDNRLVNLEMMTIKQNIHHARSKDWYSNRGTAILHIEEVLCIRRHLSQGLDRNKIAKMFEVSKSTIHAIANGQNWSTV